MNIKEFAKTFASSFNTQNQPYDDTQIADNEQSPILTEQDEPTEERVDELQSLIQNALFGLRGMENFTVDKKNARQHFYNLLSAFNSNYTVDEDELPDNITTTSKIVFIVRFIETLLDMLKLNITSAQHDIIEKLIRYALNTIVEISSI